MGGGHTAPLISGVGLPTWVVDGQAKGEGNNPPHLSPLCPHSHNLVASSFSPLPFSANSPTRKATWRLSLSQRSFLANYGPLFHFCGNQLGGFGNHRDGRADDPEYRNPEQPWLGKVYLLPSLGSAVEVLASFLPPPGPSDTKIRVRSYSKADGSRPTKLAENRWRLRT